jgi:CSLREA domain-containing protein
VRAVASIALIVLAACPYYPGRYPEITGDAALDAPPVTPKVYVVSVTSDATSFRPGRYGIAVTVVLRNELAAEISDVALVLTFGGRAEFRHRDADRREGVMVAQPTTIAAGGEATFRFVVDALPWTAAADLEINAEATFATMTGALSATPLANPMKLQYTGVNSPIAVTTAVDERNGNGVTSLREALQAANDAPGPDLIVFAPTAFPPGTVITLSDSLGELPTISADLVIDGGAGGVTLALTPSWASPEGRYGVRVISGTVALSRITFRNFGFNYRDESIRPTTDNCGTSNTQLEGGAIRVDGGTLVLESNRFEDPDVAERNCYAASVRLHGGTGHRIVGNTWTEQVMDSVFVAARTVEISDNVMVSPNSTKNDEGIYVSSQGGGDLWITGNLIVDNEYSAVVAGGTDPGTLYIVNNTFARNGKTSSGGVRRIGATRSVVLRNNLHAENNPAAIQADNNGAGFTIAYETVAGTTLCDGTCASAVVDIPTISTVADPGVVSVSGSTRADFTPVNGSPLIDAADPWLDRNAGLPRRFNGVAQERGAVELP